ncbi:hypothetical protein LSH36_2337g00001 [Paralvinella palmiformis]|uniref:Fibronectin type-III domain-containing protein n=1 Tax=Paralvinella palmiformis TaxID=53620 RepID=A0AAD9IQ82_9ANNE|nr:hypothetical protein LSH36_2337g00001 [Paralvinella palmiformis]
MIKNLSSTTLNYTVTGLDATNVYIIEVFVSTEFGEGPSRDADIESGIPPGKPHPPPPQRQSMDTQVTERQVTINWQPNNRGFGPIRNYILQIQHDDNE